MRSHEQRHHHADSRRAGAGDGRAPGCRHPPRWSRHVERYGRDRMPPPRAAPLPLPEGARPYGRRAARSKADAYRLSDVGGRMMAVEIMIFIIGAIAGSLLTAAFMSDRRPLIDQFNEIHHSPESIEQRARRVQ